MRVAVVGGGPAGLYLSILLKAADRGIDITVFERNRPADAYGFGVVFSDETLDGLHQADPETFQDISDRFKHWGEIEIRHPDGSRFVSGGHGFAAISRRALLEVLVERAVELGVDIRILHDVASVADLGPADLIVGADGANSMVRREYANRFDATLQPQRNKYIWFGTNKVFDKFTFIFEETPQGLIWAHIYPFSNQASTFIVETTPETWAALGLDKNADIPLPPGVSDLDSLSRCEAIFSTHLDGFGLLDNNSKWLQFGTITTQRWYQDNVVLMGDAVHTAHFSVGSGTKLAMEDAIALADSLLEAPDIEKALYNYQQRRQPEAESLQRAAKASLEWFEGVDRYLGMEPEQFAFSLLTRSQRITHDNLRVRDPEYMNEVLRWYAASEHRTPRPIDPSVPPMFHPMQLRDLTLPNRVVVSPMAQYSAIDGVPNDWHLVHLGSRAVGGAGLVMTEMTCVSPEGRISPACTGLWNDEQTEAWARIVDFVHRETDAKLGLQLGHAGRKGSTKRMWEGDTDPLDDGNWEVIAPSPLRYRPDSQIPREMTGADFELVVDQHVQAARRGAELGFDILELHYAHGYLLSSFLTPLANQRDDGYGGTLENRMRFPLEVFAAVRSVWPAGKPISVRISATDWAPDGFDGDDAVAFSAALKAAGCDIIDVSTGQTTVDADPEYGRLYQTPYSDRIRHEVGIPTMTVGGVSSVDDINTILVAGRADLCVIARPHLIDPYWTLNAAIDLGYTGHRWPDQYLSGMTARRREQDPISPDVFRRSG